VARGRAAVPHARARVPLRALLARRAARVGAARAASGSSRRWPCCWWRARSP
jgi:hypothetical protein